MSSCWTGRQKHLASSWAGARRGSSGPARSAPTPRPWPPPPAGPRGRRRPQVGLGVRVALHLRQHRVLVVPAREARRTMTRQARSKSSSAAASSRSKCSGVTRTRPGCAGRRAGARARPRGRPRGQPAGTARGGSAPSGSTPRPPAGPGQARLDHTGALLGLEHPQQAVEHVAGRELALEQHVPGRTEGRARLTDSGRLAALASSTCSDDSSARTEAKVRSPSLSRCRSATGRSRRCVVVRLLHSRSPSARARPGAGVDRFAGRAVAGSPPYELDASAWSRPAEGVGPAPVEPRVRQASRSRPDRRRPRHEVRQGRAGVVGEVPARPSTNFSSVTWPCCAPASPWRR